MHSLNVRIYDQMIKSHSARSFYSFETAFGASKSVQHVTTGDQEPLDISRDKTHVMLRSRVYQYEWGCGGRARI